MSNLLIVVVVIVLVAIVVIGLIVFPLFQIGDAVASKVLERRGRKEHQDILDQELKKYHQKENQ